MKPNAFSLPSFLREAVEFAELVALLGDVAGRGVGNVVGNVAAQMVRSGFEAFVGDEFFFGDGL
jgi:hypothetical protein